jgi:uncharacterized protein YkwD
MSWLKHALIPHPGNDHYPHMMRGPVLSVCTMLLAGSVTVAVYQTQLVKGGQYAAVVASVLTESANADRAAKSLDSLTVDPLLVLAAQAKANDMAQKGYFSHTSPDGSQPWDWVKRAGYSYLYAGENLAIDFSDSSAVESAWMNSPGHRANLLHQHYTNIGVATAEGTYQGHKTTFVVEMFGSPKLVERVTQAPPPSFKPEEVHVELATAAKSDRVLGAETQVLEFKDEAAIVATTTVTEVALTALEPAVESLSPESDLVRSRFSLPEKVSSARVVIVETAKGGFLDWAKTSPFTIVKYLFLLIVVLVSIPLIITLSIDTRGYAIERSMQALMFVCTALATLLVLGFHMGAPVLA